MKTELTLNVLQTMSAQEYEDIRAAGSDERRELTLRRDAGTGCAGQLDDERRVRQRVWRIFPRPGPFHACPRTFPPGVMFTGRCLSGLGSGSGECRW